MEYIRVCIDEFCTETEIRAAHILPPEASVYTDLLVNGGFSPELTQSGFIGVMSLWVAGLVVGLIIAQLRKLRS